MESLTCDTPPSEDVVALTKVKAHLFVSDSESDTHIQSLIAVAAAACSIYCGSGFGVATYTQTLDGFPCGGNPVRLPVVPLVDDETEIDYYDEDGTSATLAAEGVYIGLRTGRIVPVESWPTTQYNRPEAVTITFQAGRAAADIPAQARQAILLTVADWWANRGDGESGRDLPKAAKFLLDQLKSGWVS